jgi:hypothetical protein
MATLKRFAGTTLTWGSTTVLKLQSVKTTATCEKIDVTGSTDSEKMFEAGIPDKQLDCTLVGTSTNIIAGAKASLKCTWKDVGTFGSTVARSYVCIKADKSGEIGGAITTEASFVKAGSTG